MKSVTVENRRLVDLDTGELIETPAIKSYEPDYNFHKVWMKSFLMALGEIGNKKMKVCNYILEHMNIKNNRINLRQEEIAIKCGVSFVTVNQTFKILMKANFLRKEEYGTYIINPDIVFKGYRDDRNIIMHIYNDAERKELTKFEQYNRTKKSIETLTKRLNILEKAMREEKNAEQEQRTKAE